MTYIGIECSHDNAHKTDGMHYINVLKRNK